MAGDSDQHRDSFSRNAFDSLARNYQEFRPHYPDQSIQFLGEKISSLTDIGQSAPFCIFDVGAGTGISTRQLAAVLEKEKYQGIGIEPNQDMLKEARLSNNPSNVRYKVGNAEALPADDNSVVAIIAAQAAQWFDRNAFYGEAARIVIPGGILAVLQNNRDWTRSGFLDAYESFFGTIWKCL